ncbi:MAG: exodeoxyribonuclease alpha subunit [Thermoleophilaceae bacterium]|nr:exodeoxyribonuclease alpha subunit [Thermoleophilaceae bacterium]
MSELAVEQDRFDVRQARHAPGLLREFNDAGVLSAADVHVALRLVGLAGEDDPAVALAAALAVRGPRLGHVYVDLATICDTATVDSDEPVDLSALPWPDVADWLARLERSALVDSALRLEGSALYLDRYSREERQVAADLLAFAESGPSDVQMDVLADGVTRMFGGEGDAGQRLAAASAVLRRFAVVAGGPGTGKTTTVAGIVALLAEQAAATGAPPPLVALAAPTGKAAARLEESVHEEAARLDVSDDVRTQLLKLRATTMHRLLGWRPDSHSRFRHNRANRLPHDVVVVDETSMVSLSLMARLVEAVRPEARLVLVGDPGQLTSIEAGAVLGDIVGPVNDGLLMRPEARSALAAATGETVVASDPPSGASVGDGIVVLDRVHRFGGGIAAVAAAIRRGDPGEVISALASSPDDVTWIPVDVVDPAAQAELAPVRDAAVAAARAVIDAARAGDAGESIAALGAFRVLCAHRRGHHGVSTWMARIEGWLAEQVDGFAAGGPWYVGRPLLMTENDYGLRLYNGDTGVVVADGTDRVTAAFERQGGIARFSPTRLAAVDTVYAMTVHKSQGSQFDTAAVLLPSATSQILTRDLLYTAVTRARKRLILAGTEGTIRAAISRSAARASGLRERLWGSLPDYS